MEKITLHVEGMACGHCEIAVKDAIRKLPGIAKVKASNRKKEVVVKYDGSLATLSQIAQAIEGAGYQVIQ